MIKFNINIFINFYETDIISSIDHILKRFSFLISLLESNVNIKILNIKVII